MRLTAPMPMIAYQASRHAPAGTTPASRHDRRANAEARGARPTPSAAPIELGIADAVGSSRTSRPVTTSAWGCHFRVLRNLLRVSANASTSPSSIRHCLASGAAAGETRPTFQFQGTLPPRGAGTICSRSSKRPGEQIRLRQRRVRRPCRHARCRGLATALCRPSSAHRRAKEAAVVQHRLRELRRSVADFRPERRCLRGGSEYMGKLARVEACSPIESAGVPIRP